MPQTSARRTLTPTLDSALNDDGVIHIEDDTPPRPSKPIATLSEFPTEDSDQRWLPLGSFVCQASSTRRGTPPAKHGDEVVLYRDITAHTRTKLQAARAAVAARGARSRRRKQKADQFVRVGLPTQHGRQVFARLPAALAAIVAPVLDSGLFELRGVIMSPPPVCDVFTPIPLQVHVRAHTAAFSLFHPAANSWLLSRKPPHQVLAVHGPSCHSTDQALVRRLMQGQSSTGAGSSSADSMLAPRSSGDICVARAALKACHASLPELRERVYAMIHAAVHNQTPQLVQVSAGPAHDQPTTAAPAPSDIDPNSHSDKSDKPVDARDAETLLQGGQRAPLHNFKQTPDLMMEHLTLRPYQMQALSWMLGRERAQMPGDDDGRCIVFPSGSSAASGAGPSDAQTCTEGELPASHDQPQTATPSRTHISETPEGSVSGPSPPSLSENPLWRECALSSTTHTRRPAFDRVFVNPYSRIASLSPPPTAKPCKGGILADEMGMGKTIELLALLCQRRHERGWSCPGVLGEDDKGAPMTGEQRNGPAIKATLIVAPLSVVRQWTQEVRKFTGGALRALEHYGSGRASSPAELAQHDVVVTSYGCLKAELLALQRKDASTLAAAVAGSQVQLGVGPGGGSLRSDDSLGVLYGVHWDRIVLDEAHEIRNRETESARACFALTGHTKWCLTGTPLHNSLDDLFSLLHFLSHEPWCEHQWWKRMVTDPYKSGSQEAVHTVQAVLRPILLRRTKDMRDVDGKPIVALPPRHVTVVKLDFSPAERVFYSALYQRVQLQFEGFMAAGSVMHKYAAMLTLLLRLRQACDHPLLVLGTHGDRPSDDLTPGPAVPKDASDDALQPDVVSSLYDKFRSSASHASKEESGSTLSAGTSDATASSSAFAGLPEYVQHVLSKLSSGGTAELSCPICMMKPQGAVIGVCCAKVFCKECLDEAFKFGSSRTCPFCRKDLGDEDIISVATGQAAAAAEPNVVHSASVATMHGLAQDWLWSSKSKRVVQVLEALQSFNAQFWSLDEGDTGADGVDPVPHSSRPAGASMARFLRSGSSRESHRQPRRGTKRLRPSARGLSTRAQRRRATAGPSQPQRVLRSSRVSEGTLSSSATESGDSDSDAVVSEDSVACTPPEQAELGLATAAKHSEPQQQLGHGGIDSREIRELLGPHISTTGPMKAVVFSQWTSMLDLLEIPLRKAGLVFERLDGSMPQAKREAAVHRFKTEPKTCTMLMSMKAAALGLNLTEACICLIVDPWWNVQVEEQAIGRVWRLGATKPVIVQRFIVSASVEETLLALHEKKAALASSALAAGSSTASAKLTLDDLIAFFRGPS